MPIPYINVRADEHVRHPLEFQWSDEHRGLRLSYKDPVPQDWMYGVLWTRQGMVSTGRPEYRTVHTARQRRCMLQSLCQVCKHSAVDPENGRIWWLFPTPERYLFTNALGEYYSHIAPTCQTCIPISLAHCPHLREEAVSCTVAGVEPYAVHADVYQPRPDQSAELIARDALVQLEQFQVLGSALAKQLVVAFVDLRVSP
ncbi:hypothetical protein [Nonomuraea sp. NPDC003804]|uniref:hypothetical protein n=1 Tax=Nonomuraea sp. NPDC003804 TaxID=3154547 RepID=UPI0033A304E5